MKKNLLITLLLISVIFVDAKKISKSRSSSRGSSRKTNYNPSPTSLSNPQPQSAAAKPSLFGWQQSQPAQHKPSSYPASQTGLSGNSPAKVPSSHQESIPRSNVPQSYAGQQSPPRPAAQPQQTNNQQSHSYPSSNGGLSGSSGVGYPQQGGALSGNSAAGYPNQQGGGLSGNSGVGYPKQQGSSSLSGSGAAPPPYSSGNYPSNNHGYGNNYHHPQGPPPSYSNNHGGYGGYRPGYNGYNPVHTPQMPGYFGNHGRNYGGVSRSSSIFKGVGVAGAGIGMLMTGLALWNLARATGNRHHTVIYDNRGQPVAVAPDNNTEPVADSILGELVNCSLTISNENVTEVLAIPCAIATSFTPQADVKDAGITNNANDNTKCTVTVVTKDAREFMTTIPCSILLNTAVENNVTEPPLINNGTEFVNGTTGIPSEASSSEQPLALKISGETVVPNLSLNCTAEPGDIRDPINPCFAVSQNLTVIPLQSTDMSNAGLLSTPSSA